MEKVGLVLSELMRAAAMGIVMLLVPIAASASTQDTGDHAHVARGSSVAHQDASSLLESDGVIPADDHRLHCHLLSTPSMAIGANQSRDDVQATAPARVVPAIVAGHMGARSPLASPIPIAAPPPYILFGNFRS